MSDSGNGVIKSLEDQMPPLYAKYKQLVTPSEVPDEFHLFVFMTMLSALVGDKIYFKEGNDDIYPNLWTMLVGESGTSRKSTAFRPALKIVRKTNKVHLLAPKGSSEGFFEDLVEHEGVGLLRHSELGSLLGSLRKDYMGGFVDELCEYYDPCPVVLLKRLSKKQFEVAHLAISWIAATTPDSLNKCDANERVASGFLPRWNIVFGEQPTTLVHFRLPKHPTYFDDFVKKLMELYPAKPCEIKFSDDAMTVHKEWYEKHRPRVQNGTIGYFQIRILEVVKKYAVLLAFLNARKSVEKDDMMLAVKFGDYFFSTATRLMAKEIAENQFERDCQKILRAIPRAKAERKPTSQRELMRRTSLKLVIFHDCMKMLLARGDVEQNKDYTFDLV